MTTSPTPDARRQAAASDDYERFIERQIRRTRGQVKLVDLFTRLLVLVCGVLGLLFLLALADHWLLSGGLGPAGRVVGFSTIVVGAAVYLAWRVLPLIAGRINPIYAAHAIEHNQPAARNSLINYLLLRGNRKAIHRSVFQAMRNRAANDLSKVNIEHVVDRGPLLRVAYVLLAIVALFSLYKLLSPKDPLRSIGRVMMPWSAIARPTRVTIADVQPGNATAFYGDVLEVSAHVRGCKPDEPVTVLYTSDDGQTVDVTIAMQVPEGGYRHRAPLPEGSQGLQQSLHYTIVAGDARRGPFHVTVSEAPAIRVESVEYHYPDYTALAPRRVTAQSDLQAVEGTRVTLHARANCEIERAWLDLDCDGRRDRPLQVTGSAVRGEIQLTLGADGRAEHSSYQIRFTNHEGYENPRPVRHHISVLPDAPPVVRIRRPTELESEVSLDGSQEIVVWARDQDFALSGVWLKFVAGDGRVVVNQRLLSDTRPDEWTSTYRFEPAKWQLASGEVVTYWAEAIDNRQPKPNRTESDHHRLRIVSPAAHPGQNQLAQNDNKPGNRPQPAKQGGEGSAEAGAEAGENGQPPDAASPDAAQKDRGETSTSKDAPGAQSPDSQEKSRQGDVARRIDPESNPGDAFEKILEHARQQPPEEGEASADEPQQGAAGSEPPPKETPPENSENRATEPEDQSQQASGKEQGEGESGQNQGSPAEQPPANQQQGGASGGQSRGQDTPSGEGGQQGGGDKSGQGSRDSQASGDRKGQGGAAGQMKEKPPSADGSPTAESREGKPKSGRVSRADSDQPPPGKSTSPRSSAGRGDQAQDAGALKERQRPKNGEAPKAEGGEPHDAKGPSGAGQSQGNQKGAPEPQENNQPRDKRQSSPQNSQAQEKQEQPTSPTTSPKESDSQGGEEGDRSGGGQEGGGQKANAKGTGGAGQNTASDQGGSATAGSGEGQTSDRAGDKTTGQPPKQGQGRKQSGPGQSSDSGAPQPGAGQGDGKTSAADDAPNDSPGGDAAKQNSGGKSGPKSGNSGGASNLSGDGGGGSQQPQANQTPPAAADDQIEPGGDKANLDYARKATELAIQHLKDQLARDKLDATLLDELGWTRKDAQQFVEQWEKLRREAGQGSNPQARQQFNDALRSLGLSPRSTLLRGHGGSNRLELQESRRIAPPRNYREQFEAYTESTAKSRPSRQTPE